MKLLLAICSLAALNAQGASKDSGRIPNMVIGFEAFQPLLTTEDMMFNRNQWVVKPDDDYLQQYNPLGTGLFVQVKCRQVWLGLRAGMVYGATREENGYVFPAGFPGGPSTTYKSVDNSYRQDQYRLGAYIKSMHQFNRISIGMGAELAAHCYNKGHLQQEAWTNSTFTTSDMIEYEYYQKFEYNSPSGVVSSLGAFFECRYQLEKSFSFGLQVSQYAAFYKFDKPMDIIYSNYSIRYNQDGTIGSGTKTPMSNQYQVNSDYTHVSLGRLCPSISLAYHFNVRSRIKVGPR